MVKNKIKRCFPLLLAFVILISCLPVIPVAASTLYDVSGSWQFNFDVTLPYDRVLEFNYGFTTSDGSRWDYFEMYDGDLWFSGDSGDVCFYDGALNGGWSEGQDGVFDRVITFPSGTRVDADSYDLLTTFASRYYVPIFSSIVTIDGQVFTFTGSFEQPKVTLQVNGTGAILSGVDSHQQYIYSGTGTFLGLSYSANGDPAFVPGQTYELAAGDHMLYPISDAPLPVQPTTTINIYNNAGTQLLYSFKASSADASPRVTVAPSASSITFTVPDQDPVVFSGVYSSFTGLALKPQATAPAVVLGQTLSIGGKTSDSVLDLYCTYESGFADPSDIDFVSWLASAVGGFLAFELWPGMSLDQILWVILVIGILMWFLKVIM